MKKLGLSTLLLAGVLAVSGCAIGSKDDASYLGYYEFEYIEIKESKERYYTCSVDTELELAYETSEGGVSSTVSMNCVDIPKRILISETHFDFLGSPDGENIEYIVENNELWADITQNNSTDKRYKYLAKLENGKLEVLENEYYKLVYTKK